MEEKDTGKKNFDPTNHDFDFNFDFDLSLNAFDYLLLGLYFLFVLPLILFAELLSKAFRMNNAGTKADEKQLEISTLFQSELCVAPCCQWPRALDY